MKKLIDLITEEMKGAFEKAGYDPELGKVSVSNRPDLCEYQCNGAMAGAKLYHKAPVAIAGEVAGKLAESRVFSMAEAVNPGFLNLKLREDFLSEYLKEMAASEKYGLEAPEKPKTVIVDYGGPNVAKPLHVGHLRSAVIGEAVKRLCAYVGHRAIGDIHMGDWGLQMGLVITEIRERMPDLPYFDPDFDGEYPEDAPCTVEDLSEIYPTASGKSKDDPAYRERAMEATLKLQNGDRGCRALWERIMKISVENMKEIYDSLDVHFELWNGESTVQELIPGMLRYLKEKDYMHLSEGAWVIDVKEESDTKEMPPCIVVKSDGASLYNTTDLATIMDRVHKYAPEQMIYLTDKRQDLYFEQVFRAARKSGLVPSETELVHIGFGTVNGKDGHAFKTREGGVMKLSDLIADTCERTHDRILESREMPEEEALKTASIVALAALKYGDLSNQATKDYIFDMEKFTSFEGDTGPYILYTIVRIKSILAKIAESGTDLGKAVFSVSRSEAEKSLMTDLARFNAVIEAAYREIAPHRICAYIYELANDFNRFYHETKIVTEEDEEKKSGWIALLLLAKGILETCIGILGFTAPDKM
ncbi:MAG: arginine--tRNA ligase [Lachnospiraceae bacterium]|nr:arginine--tRNA ligase [Lachnospiraceae bacterium]